MLIIHATDMNLTKIYEASHYGALSIQYGSGLRSLMNMDCYCGAPGHAAAGSYLLLIRPE